MNKLLITALISIFAFNNFTYTSEFEEGTLQEQQVKEEKRETPSSESNEGSKNLDDIINEIVKNQIDLAIEQIVETANDENTDRETGNRLRKALVYIINNELDESKMANFIVYARDRQWNNLFNLFNI